jgi:hypothetical protein
MKLPDSKNLIVEKEKIIAYLLNPNHPVGGAKAKFFQEFGFRREKWEELAEALREHGARNEITTSAETEFGARYSVSGPLTTPSPVRPNIVSVWQKDHGSIAPRLITAYPDKKV